MRPLLRAMSHPLARARIVGEAARVRQALRGRVVGAAAVVGVVALVSGAGCGGTQDTQIGMAAGPSSHVDEWPLPAPAKGATASTVQGVLQTADGAQVTVRAYLLALTVPCPSCNVGTRTVLREDAIGRTGRPEGPMAPGCSACPPPAVTIGDEPPRASASASASAGAAGAPLRATGGAEGLQPRHIGKLFLFTGTFHAGGEHGPELEVTDVRALSP